MHTHTKDDWPVSYTLCSLLCNDTLSKLLQTLYNDNVSWNAFFLSPFIQDCCSWFCINYIFSMRMMWSLLEVYPYPFFFNFFLIVLFCRNKQEKPKIHGYVEDVVDAYDEQTFRRMYRMSNNNFNTLYNYLKDLDELTNKGFGGKPPIPPKKQLLVTLWYLGSLDTINRIGDRFGISDSFVVLCRDRAMSAMLNHLKQKFITWPN